MTTYAIGDVQGCYSPLLALLEKINFDVKKDKILLTGDLVNRGPASLEVLRFVKSLGDKAVVVLGNHDLHLLATYYAHLQPKMHDTLNDILSAPDCDELMEWFCHQPLLYEDESGFLMTHAGLAPMWSIEKAKLLAKEVEVVLQSDKRVDLFSHLYGNQPDLWRDDLKGIDRLRCIINYFTRMRFCDEAGRLDLNYKGTILDAPAHLHPWFQVKPRVNEKVKIIFGHWAALNGESQNENIYPLDTGCVWGNCLTAMRLDTLERISVTCA